MRNTTKPNDVVRHDGNRLIIGNPNAVTTIDAKSLEEQIASASRYYLPTEKLCIAGEVRLSGDASYLFAVTSYAHDKTPLRKVRKIEGLQRIDTSEVTSMEGMFCEMRSLESVEGIKNWDTHNVRSMRAMFICCEKLPDIDVSGFDTSSVTDMADMFNGCYSLTSLDLSHFDMSNVTDISGMCANCLRLEDVNIAGWDAPQLGSMHDMFSRCKCLRELNTTGISIDSDSMSEAFFDSMSGMFFGCESLETLDLSGINVTAHNSAFAFEGCSSLRTVDLSNLDIDPSAGMVYMFAGCDSLETVKLTETMRRELSRRQSLPTAAQTTRTPIAVVDEFNDDETIGIAYQLD